MTFVPGSDEELARVVTRLVDESLRPRERRAIEAWATERPDITGQVTMQRRVAQALRSGGPPVPEALAATVAARAPARRRLPLRLARLRSTGPAGAVAMFAMGALAAAVVAISLGNVSGHREPSVALAAKLAFSPATEAAPAARTARLLDVTYAGITFPNYGPRFGAVPTGQRVDRLAGRPALTVFYRLRGGARLSYTVYSGAPVPLPHALTQVLFAGVRLRVVPVRSRLAVVTLVRHGHTCVLAAPTAADTVVALAEAPLQRRAA